MYSPKLFCVPETLAYLEQGSRSGGYHPLHEDLRGWNEVELSILHELVYEFRLKIFYCITAGREHRQQTQ